VLWRAGIPVTEVAAALRGVRTGGAVAQATAAPIATHRGTAFGVGRARSLRRQAADLAEPALAAAAIAAGAAARSARPATLALAARGAAVAAAIAVVAARGCQLRAADSASTTAIAAIGVLCAARAVLHAAGFATGGDGLAHDGLSETGAAVGHGTRLSKLLAAPAASLRAGSTAAFARQRAR